MIFFRLLTLRRQLSGTVNSKIFAMFFFSRNFAYAKFLENYTSQNGESLCHLLMKINHVIVVNFYVANMSFNAIQENKFLAKISEFTVLPSKFVSLNPSCTNGISHKV